MQKLTDNAIHANLEALATPANWPTSQLAGLAESLCALQQTLAPVTTPRRLVLFAADHGPGDESEIGPAVREVVSGAAATAVLAKSTHTDFVVIDIGSRCLPLLESAHYRCRKVRSGSRDFTKEPALTADEFRAAFIVGQSEAERAAKDGMKVVAVDALGKGSERPAIGVRLTLSTLATVDDLIPALAKVGGADLAAAAGFIAKGVELGLAVLVNGLVAGVAAEIADRLYPGTQAKVLECEGALGSLSDGLGAIMAFQLLDSVAGIVTNTARRIHRREQVVPIKRRKVAVFTGSFDPPTTFHRRVAKMLRGRGFDEVIVRPKGPREGDDEVEHAAPIHRAVMADLAFRDLPGVTVDLSDIDDGVFTPPAAFNDLYADHGEVWHVVSDEFIAGGRTGQSAIQTKWEMGDDMWAGGRFIVLHPNGCVPNPLDHPPVCQLITADSHVPTYDIRLRVFQGGTAHPDVPEAVEAYIRRYGLFSGKPTPRETRVRLADIRLKLVFDERNEKAHKFAKQFRRYETSDPTHILVLGGDGTMLQAIRDLWPLRLPFIGLNAGTLGFLMNESLPSELGETELVLYRLPMLRVDCELPDGKRSRSLACADAWVERESGQAAWLRVDVDGHTQVPRVVGDGLLIATPSGSSAYARAMGATPVPLTAPVLTLAGSNVFLPRFWRPVTLPETAVVSLTSLDHNGKRPVRGFIDGRTAGKVRSMEIRVSTVAAVELGFTPQFDLSARLLRSMFPPTEM